MGWTQRLRNTIWPSRRGGDFEEEARFHLERRAEEYVRRGLSTEDAIREAKRRLGNLTLARERTRDADTLRWFADVIQDARYAGRALLKSPGFAIIAVLTLGLGIGLNTAMFIFGEALILRPPDLPRSAELVQVFGNTRDEPFGKIAYPDYLDFRDRTTTLSGLAAYTTLTIPVSRAGDTASRLTGVDVVSGNYFQVLEVEPVLGRGFSPQDDRPGTDAVAVISERLAERMFGSGPRAVGQALTVGNRRFTVIGIAAPRAAKVDLLAIAPNVYIPIGTASGITSGVPAHPDVDRVTAWLSAIGRLKPGVSPSRASSEISDLARALQRSYPDTNRGRSAVVLQVMAARKALGAARQQAVMLLLAIAGLVLLIACANVANLLLSHAAGRTNEIAVRLALGASRGRLIRQLLTESLLLALAGGLCGVAFADAGVRYLSALVQSILSAFDVAPVVDLRFDERVVWFTVFVALFTLVLFGLAPALRSTRVDLVSSLKASKRGTRRRRRITGRSALVASQVALSVVVLAMAALSIRQAIAIRYVEPGFRTDHVLVATFDPSSVGEDQDHTRQFFDRLEAQARALPGIKAAGLTQDVPLVSGYHFTPVVIDGADMPKGQDAVSVRSFIVDPGYWQVTGTPLLRGRLIDRRDTATGSPVVLVNDTMARRYWPNRDALGRTVHVDGRSGQAAEVVGIVKDGKYGTINESPQPAIFMPYTQSHASTAMKLMLWTAGNPTAFAAEIRAEARALGVPAFNMRSLDDMYQRLVMGQQSLVSQMMVFVGLLGLVLTIIGLYGVIAYLTALRSREIGIRMALGAARGAIVAMVMKQAAAMVIPGLIVGLGLTYVLMPAFAVAFNFAPHHALVFAGVVLALITTALAASSIPTRRAIRIDPAVALREE